MIVGRVFQRLARKISGSRSSLPKLLFVLVVLAALPALAYWRGFGLDASEVGANASEMVVDKLEPTPNRINLILKEKSGPRRLVLSLGQAEAGSIVQDLKLPYRVDPPVTAYSMTRSLAEGAGVRIQRVVVSDASDTALFAKIVIATDNREVAIDAAPNDAIALALRSNAPIFAEQIVLQKAGVVSGR